MFYHTMIECIEFNILNKLYISLKYLLKYYLSMILNCIIIKKIFFNECSPHFLAIYLIEFLHDIMQDDLRFDLNLKCL